MNKSELVRGVSADTGMGDGFVETVINKFLDTIALSLACGEDVMISNFGKFEVRHRRPVMRRNPQTGDPVAVPEKTALGFKAAPALKNRVNGLQ